MTPVPTLEWKQELVGLVNLLMSEYVSSDEAVLWWDTPNEALGNRTPATVILEAVHPFQEDIECLLRSIGGSHGGLHRDPNEGS